jgi:hypothetical protein
MKRFKAVATGLCILSLCSWCEAQNPSFALDFDAPSGIEGDAGSDVSYSAIGKLTTTGLSPSDPGAQGWSLSMASEGSAIADVTTAGTIVDSLFTGGFNKTELTTGAGNEGAVSAVVLSFSSPVTLPNEGTVDVVRVTLGATVPDPVLDTSGDPTCEPILSRVFFVNGRQGSGQPVDNKVTYKGQTKLPTLGDASTTICPKIARPLLLRTDVLTPASDPGSKDGNRTPWHVSVGAGTDSLDLTVGVVLVSNLPGPDGPQGWSMSVLTEPCFGIQSATTSGTDVDTHFSGGFIKTEVVDPARNSGQQGAVSAVVLSFTEERELPIVGESLVLKIVGRADTSAIQGPGDAVGPCLVIPAESGTPGLRGSGQPVKTAITVNGSTHAPGTCGAAITIGGANQGRFVRGNANNDFKDDIADAVWIVNELFRHGSPTLCRDAADANNDAMVDLSDALYLISYQFEAGPPPPEPFSTCGLDPEADSDGIPCDSDQVRC